MKVFLSYGHRDHANLVDAVFDALVQAGHEPWKDDRYEGRSGIKPGQDFTQVIYRAIDESDFVLAFVTAQTLERDYCCDERNYAYNQKGSRFIQLRLDGAPIRLGNARSYLDLDDALLTNSEINADVLRQKLHAIFEAMRDPESFAAGGWNPWAKFEAHLRVKGAVPYGEIFSLPESADFVGREWLKEQCVCWAMDDTIPCRLFVILGEAGTGKSAFVRHLAADRTLARSVHICRYDRPATRTVRDTLKDLSYVLLQNNPRYLEFLQSKPFDKLDELTPDGLFEYLFLEPLRDENDKYLLIIDGLDELNEEFDFRTLMQLFREYAHRLNPNISILVTGRPDARLLSALSTIVVHGRPAERVTLDEAHNLGDLRLYIRRKLTDLALDDPDLPDRLLEACDCNFEYLALLFQEAEHEGLQITDRTVMPKGLFARYTQYLERRLQMARQGDRLTGDQRKLLSVIAAAEEPLSLRLLAKLTDLDEDDVEDALSVFGSLIRMDHSGYVSFFSKRFRDYLLESPVQAFRIRRERGDRIIADHLIRRCKTAAALTADPYLAKRGLLHLLRCAAEEPETAGEAESYLTALQKTGADAIAFAMAYALSSREAAVMRVYFEMQVFAGAESKLKALRDKETLELMASAYEADGQTLRALLLRGDLARDRHTPEGDAEAAALYQKSLAIAEQRYIENPCPASRVNLSGVYDRLGFVAISKHTPEGNAEAKQWYSKILVLDEQNYAEHPTYESRRSLATVYDRLGKLARNKHTPKGDAEADRWYRKRLELDEQNYAEQPCYESRRNLGTAYRNLGILASDKFSQKGAEEIVKWYSTALILFEINHKEYPSYRTNIELYLTYCSLGALFLDKRTPKWDSEAKKWYEKALEIAEQNHLSNPDYESRFSLGTVFECLGEIASHMRTPEGNAEALKWHKKAVKLEEQNYAEHPDYAIGIGLGSSYCKLGDLERDKYTPEGNAKAAVWYQKALAIDERNYTEHPDYLSRLHLSMTYQTRGMFESDKHTPEGDAEAERWYLKALELNKQNYAEHPSYESRRSICITYYKLGAFASNKHTPESEEKAEQWFRKVLELLEQNYAERPCSECKNDLKAAYDQLYQLALTRNKSDKAAYWKEKSESIQS